MTVPASGSLFTGTGALDMAAAEVLGARPSWFAEYEPPTDKNPRPKQAAARLLAYRYPTVPNLGDITVVDWGLVAKLAPVEVLTAGWPCQPFSLAGKQLGAEDERALWPEVDRCLRALRPRYVLLENVPVVVGAELGRVADTLASLGYRFAWVSVPASAVGAPHKRLRLFILAVADADCTRWEGREPAGRRVVPSRRAPANTGSVEERHQPVAEPGSARQTLVGRDHSAPADTDGGGLPGYPERDLGAQGGIEAPRRQDADGRVPDWAGYGPAVRRWEAILGRPAPAPTTVGTRGGRVLNPALPEWMMGLPDGWIIAVPGLTRNEKLKLAGNGVVKLQAVAAYRYLLDVLDRDVGVAA